MIYKKLYTKQCFATPWVALVWILMIQACAHKSFSQKSTVVIHQKNQKIETDNIGNTYLIKGEELMKHQPDGKLIARYSNLKLGDITTADVTNPLKIMLYYRDFQQIVFLDNQLTENSQSISLETLGHEQTELACASTNNSFWIFDKQNNELLRYNENSKQIASTGNLKQILQANIAPSQILESNNLLYMNCPEIGILVFDMFGAYVRTISLQHLSNIQVEGDHLIFYRAPKFCRYDHKLFIETCKEIPQINNLKEVRHSASKTIYNYSDSVMVVPD